MVRAWWICGTCGRRRAYKDRADKCCTLKGQDMAKPTDEKLALALQVVQTLKPASGHSINGGGFKDSQTGKENRAYEAALEVLAKHLEA